MIELGSYQFHACDVAKGLDELTPAKAKARVMACLAIRNERLEMFGELLERNGVALELNRDGVKAVSEWIYHSVDRDPDVPGMFQSVWWSILHDAGFLVGEVALDEHPHLRWEFYRWKGHGHHRHVLLGFSERRSRLSYNVHDAVEQVAFGGVHDRGWLPPAEVVDVRGVKILINDPSRPIKPTSPSRLVEILDGISYLVETARASE